MSPSKFTTSNPPPPPQNNYVLAALPHATVRSVNYFQDKPGTLSPLSSYLLSFVVSYLYHLSNCLCIRSVVINLWVANLF